jgi:hypothetical protein
MMKHTTLSTRLLQSQNCEEIKLSCYSVTVKFIHDYENICDNGILIQLFCF